MTEEQKAQALALRRIHAVFQWSESHQMPRDWIDDHGATVPVLNLADETGAVEGVLHRVLERLVGAAVELVTVWPDPFSGPRWTARKCDRGPFPSGDHPTRLDAIVAAMLALEAAKGATHAAR